MAMKWAFLGTYCSILYLIHQEVSDIYGFFPNVVDWLQQISKITQVKHKDAIVMTSYQYKIIMRHRFILRHTIHTIFFGGS
jgi:hypothetical protein